MLFLVPRATERTQSVKCNGRLGIFRQQAANSRGMPRDIFQELPRTGDLATAQSPTGRVARPRRLLLGVGGERAQGGWARHEPLFSPSGVCTGAPALLRSLLPAALSRGHREPPEGGGCERMHPREQALCFNIKIILECFLRYAPPCGPSQEVFYARKGFMAK